MNTSLPSAPSNGEGRRSPALRSALIDLYSHSAAQRIYARLKLSIIPFEQFSQYLPKSGAILDMGCGFGYVANYLSLESLEGRGTGDRFIVGIDPAESRIAVARQTIGNRRNVEFMATDCRDLPRADFDGAVIADVIHHTPYDQHVPILTDVYAKLKPGATLVMRETAKKFRIRYFVFNVFSEWILYYGQEKLKFRRTAEWKHILETIGFEVRDIIPNGPLFPYTTSLFICIKPNNPGR